MVQNPLLPQLAGVRPSLAATSPWDFEKDPTRCFNGWFVEGNIIENVYIYILMDNHPRKWYINYNG
jgi:hypothetical protein